MTPKHAYFEFLSVLAESGQLSPSENQELRAHCKLCAPCRDRLTEFTQLGAVIVFANPMNHPRHRTPRGMRQRFIARAICEGVPIKQPASAAGAVNLILASVTLLVLLIAGSIVSQNRIPASPTPAERAQNSNPSPREASTPDRPPAVAHESGRRVRAIESGHPTSASASHHRTLSPQPVSIQEASSAAVTLASMEGHNLSSRFTRYKFPIPRGTPGRDPLVLTVCICKPLAPISFGSNLAMTSAAQLFHPDAETTLKPQYRLNPAELRLVDNVVQ